MKGLLEWRQSKLFSFSIFVIQFNYLQKFETWYIQTSIKMPLIVILFKFRCIAWFFWWCIFKRICVRNSCLENYLQFPNSAFVKFKSFRKATLLFSFETNIRKVMRSVKTHLAKKIKDLSWCWLGNIFVGRKKIKDRKKDLRKKEWKLKKERMI